MDANGKITAVVLLGLTMTACGGAGGRSALPQPAAATRATWSGNLIVNGNAERGDATATGYDAVTIPGWQAGGLPTVAAYGDPGPFPAANSPGPPNRGKNFFAGGQLGDSTLTQTIGLATAAGAIDAGGAQYVLSGWLGGAGSHEDNARVIATFLNAAGRPLGTVTIGPVTATQRKHVTGLLYRRLQAGVPVATRSINIVVQNTKISAYNSAYSDDLSLTISTPIPTPPAPTPPPAHVPAFDHVYEFMMENEWFPEIVGNTAQAPYINSLIAKGSLLSNMFAIEHPSDPNYVAIASGSTYQLDADAWPTTTIDHRHLADLIEDSGRSWKVYMQGSNGPCDQTQHHYYYPDDSPYMFFKDVRDNLPRCRKHIVPIDTMASDFANASTTPNYAWVAPNDCDDMESCGITAGDAWLSRTIPVILKSPSWKAGKSIIILTFDEDDYKHDQNIPAFVIGAGVKIRYVSKTFYTHYSVLRTIEAAFGLRTLTLNDLYANPINDIWR